ncbi:Lrp/AsnC family transcriptional regulator [Halobellus salinisoli]|uniref:Lrp/AsnC family transcriptional regulator n=1 Tax=Halobellus salinisoli TaxID=3108500 RepID=UPI00300B380C
MVHAYIMVKTGPGTSEQIVKSIRGLATVAEAHIVAGAYDIIVEADAEAVYEILNAASNEIQGLTGVTDTKTYIAMG